MLLDSAIFSCTDSKPLQVTVVTAGVLFRYTI